MREWGVRTLRTPSGDTSSMRLVGIPAIIRVQDFDTFSEILAFEQYFTRLQDAHLRRRTGGLYGSREPAHLKQVSHASAEDALDQKMNACCGLSKLVRDSHG